VILNRTSAAGSAVIAIMVAGCATPGSVSARSGVAPLPSSVGPSSGPAPASSSDVSSSDVSSSDVSSSDVSSSDAGLGDTRPPCPSANFQLILGPNASPRPGPDAAIHKPFGDVGVNFGPQLPGATVLWVRLDVVVTDATPMVPPDPTADPSVFAAEERARPDSVEKLAAGTDPHVARATLKPFAPGRFVIPAAVLNALPADVPSYTVYLVESVDESVCFGATPDPSLAASEAGAGYSVIADLVP
jgi:hypothetical protein